MTDTYFEILRAGTNSSIQDHGRKNFYHIGISISGAMDQKIFKLSNALVNNNLNEGVIEFAYQGPLLRLKNGSVNFVITGNVNFNILRKNLVVEKGKCFQSYFLEKDDQIDIISTDKSAYGYLSIQKGFKGDYFWGSCSINTKSEIGSNNGKKFSVNDRIYLNQSENEFCSNKIKVLGSKFIICLHNSFPIDPPAPVTRTILFVISIFILFFSGVTGSLPRRS